ncbi:DUF4097 family beta strand repeat-containing protein [Streptomyces showdoensis]|uniref:DUF4097 domain-containing protein n=1 Tax=Streptomyces showdoensis TaxID=68268 RepID=A0A2P2GIP5_STREW|nr:DUF4097 family beta strand repeat-containing protein [Streptomyces showdoensis]KKZ71382.1 hypothetical protein VO63_23615 [Streptomyces showdoensis]
MQNFATTAPIAAVLNIPAGRVEFLAADREDATVEVRPANAAKGQDVKAAERVEVTFADGVLRIAAPEAERKVLGGSGVVEVTVQLPAGSRVEAGVAAGELRGTGRLGDVVLETAQGPVTLDEAASARVDVQDGAITIGRLTGPAELRTRQGDITVTEAVRGAVELRTEKGDITVGAAHGASAALDAGTGYGRIDNALRNTEGAAAGLTFRATTAYGDITARSN